MKRFSKFYVMMFLLFSIISFASFAASDPDLDRLEEVYNEVIVNGNKDFLGGFSKKELAIIRNTIYAKKGYKFKRKEYQKYFGAKEWYKGTTNKQNILNRKEQKYFGAKDWYKGTTSKQNILNKNEQKLVDIIVKYEKNGGSSNGSSEYSAPSTQMPDLDSGSPTTEEIEATSETDSGSTHYINLD